MKYNGRITLLLLSLLTSCVFLVFGNNYNPYLLIFSVVNAGIAWLFGSLYDQYKFLSFNDYLTKVYNRRYGYKVIPKLISLANLRNEPLAILNIDINNFKWMNDNYGHEYGDQILQEFSNIVLHSIRKSDQLFRWGGDEFLVVLQNADQQAADKLSKRLNETVNSGLKKSMKEIDVNLSIGYSIFPDDGQTFDKLVSVADNNMYEVKELSKSR
ncbi:GGDEF domain-containing protein [Paucisalibacillus globulus]|uniref:GGDEF domain-containing protein n=1 Tax=Paucisalibacillus globulus TaxID=351095 RepID=UPI000BB84E2F|nr:GGDEF domain-containing protein [Paucisalibacillus globulus]